jgi:hypothetical protein
MIRVAKMRNEVRSQISKMEALTARKIAEFEVGAVGGIGRVTIPSVSAQGADSVSPTQAPDTGPAALADSVDNRTTTSDDAIMSDMNREELNARLETIEVRMDGRVASIEANFAGFAARMDDRSANTDARFERMEYTIKDTLASIGSLKTTIILTALSTVLAIVIGMAAFNATVLSNMLASFESGKNMSAAQAEIKRQTEETATLLRELKANLPPKPASK